MAILGIDEVGRGPLAGPLVIGAVILPEKRPEWASELRDSKKLKAKKREELAKIILSEAPATGLGWVTPAEIDEVGIGEALRLAARRAVEEVQKKKEPFSQIIIDGKVNFLSGTRLERFVSTAIKADVLIKEVSAASIIAKVARDRYMVEAAEKYPRYGFEKHVGYGTKAHLEAIYELGISEIHRRSFEPIRSLVGFEREGTVVKNTTARGQNGEERVALYLEGLGHKIVARNFKTKICEIDVVSIHGDTIYFTEVKTRKNGEGLAAIDKKKLEKMKLGVEVFLKFRPEYKKYNPLLAAASVDGDWRVLDWLIIR